MTSFPPNKHSHARALEAADAGAPKHCILMELLKQFGNLRGSRRIFEVPWGVLDRTQQSSLGRIDIAQRLDASCNLRVHQKAEMRRMGAAI